MSIGTDERSPGGRKAGLYRLDENFSHALLLFVQEQKIFYAVGDALEKQTDRKEVCCEHGQFIMERMKEVIVQRMEQDEKIQVIVVGIPGAVYRGQIKFIDGYEELKERSLEKKKMHRQENNLVCVHLASTGPGCGAVVNGKPITGYKEFSGEVGFMPLFGDRTLQDVAMDHFNNVEPGEYLGKLISCICALMNPENITLYLEQDWKISRRRRATGVKNFYPKRLFPGLLFLTVIRKTICMV